jgi:PPK2 family polyphosphate:nucleotide phosphotransferase
MAKLEKLARRFRVNHGGKFRLEDVNPADTHGVSSAEEAHELLGAGLKRLSELQDKLYAQQKWAILLIVQAMDAGGKDSLIKHVMSGVNPAGCHVASFKQPSAEELRYPFLRRGLLPLPERGMVGIYNRSYYEETLVVRVHPELLAAEQLPDSLVSKKIWQERYQDIGAFERHLARSGIVVRKFFLHVSKAEQKKRFLKRLDKPEKNWKFSEQDVQERQFWPQYMEAYEDLIRNTAAPQAPWYVVPADHKWFTQIIVAAAIVDTLDELCLEYPRVDGQRRKELAAARRRLESEPD